MYKAIFIFKDGTRCVCHYRECTDMIFTEAIQEAFESAKQRKDSMYLGEFDITKIYYRGKSLNSVDFWLSSEDVQNVRLWSVGKN